jgi:hypothetical protein
MVNKFIDVEKKIGACIPEVNQAWPCTSKMHCRMQFPNVLFKTFNICSLASLLAFKKNPLLVLEDYTTS